MLVAHDYKGNTESSGGPLSSSRRPGEALNRRAPVALPAPARDPRKRVPRLSTISLLAPFFLLSLTLFLLLSRTPPVSSLFLLRFSRSLSLFLSRRVATLASTIRSFPTPNHLIASYVSRSVFLARPRTLLCRTRECLSVSLDLTRSTLPSTPSNTPAFYPSPWGLLHQEWERRYARKKERERNTLNSQGGESRSKTLAFSLFCAPPVNPFSLVIFHPSSTALRSSSMEKHEFLRTMLSLY